MVELLHADIFFFVTTIAVLVLLILVSIALIYLIRFLRDIRYVARRAREESDLLSEDLANLRVAVRKEGFKAIHVARFFRSVFGSSRRARSSDKKD